jgi:hypothetical protein
MIDHHSVDTRRLTGLVEDLPGGRVAQVSPPVDTTMADTRAFAQGL